MTDWLSPKEIAADSRFGYRAILNAIRRGDLEAFEPTPGQYRVLRTEYERWKTARRVEPADDLIADVAASDSRRRGMKGAQVASLADLRAIKRGAA